MVERELLLGAETIDQARGWYVIHHEEMTDGLLGALWRTYTGSLDQAELRQRLSSVVHDIVESGFSTRLHAANLEEIGARVADLCNATLEGLEEFRQAVPMVVTQELPGHLTYFVESRIERVLTTLIWGYCARVAESVRRAVDPPAVETEGSHDVLGAYFMNHPSAMVVQSIETGYTLSVNRRFEMIFGRTLAEYRRAGFEDLVAPETARDMREAIADLRSGRVESFQRRSAMRHRLGHTVWYDVEVFRMYDQQHHPRWIGYTYNPTPPAGSAGDAESMRIRMLAELSLDPSLIVASTGAITYASAATERLLGFRSVDLLDQPISSLILEDDLSLIELLFASLDKRPRATDRMELRLRRKDGGWRWVELAGANLLDIREIAGYSLQARDITDRKRLEQILTMQAHLDPLTSLLNRRGMMEQVDAALRDRDRVAVLFIDLDSFKTINDRHGHIVGDVVLRTIAERLGSRVATLGIAGRLGGDEFLVLANSAEPFHLERIREQVMTVLSDTIEVDGEHLRVGGSIGVAWSDPGTSSSIDLVRKADVEMYRAKSQRSA